MQITIIQSEIEQAIRNYVSSQLKVADGMEMSIDISATRGAEGFKATIDIHPIGSENQQQSEQPKAAQIASVVKPIFTPRSLTTAISTNPALVETAQEAQKLNNPPFDGNDTAQTIDEASASNTTDAAQQDDAPAAAASGGRSLFKGLAKPKNS